jgi:preprotein translocase subunit SecA
MLELLKKIFGTQQTRLVKRYFRIVKKINEKAEEFKNLTDDELLAKTTEFKERIKNGATPEDLLVEAYAVVKNACRRLSGTEIHVSGYTQKWDMVPYDVQIVGAVAMHYGAIAEMQTGEGKTLTSAMPLYLHALTGKPVHLVTVNDYLAKRDAEWVGSIFRWLGLTVSVLVNQVPPEQRREFYKADIVYGTASEFGFDYLRDNSMATSKYEQCQRGYYFAVIDEVDSILIDEARTPLIISGPSSVSRQMYDVLKEPVLEMVKLQRDECNKLASEARRIFEKLNLLEDDAEPAKLTKEENAELEEALKKIWLVSKGTPINKILKRIRENPDLRAKLDLLETYYWGDQNKEERLEALSKLYIIVDERGNEYELTDLGVKHWKGDESAFTMLDLGHEYAVIDQNGALSDQEKMQKKVELREADAHRKEISHNVRQLFRAHLLMEKDVDYIVQEGKIVIIDENTGRAQPGRRFSDGLHQAIEAKEAVAIQKETQTYATITLQNYFRLYNRLAGMTGTAITEAQELKEIYKIEVLEIPTHKKCQRDDQNDEIYMTEREKYAAILKEIIEIHETGRPILIGTESVEISEKLSRILKNQKLEHTVLNAKQNDKEAEIIAAAGTKGAITVSTNMAGRGTDIKLGEGVAQLGGLHVVGTSRHQSRRIDRQLRGRSGRQGDPGSSKFYVSFEDSLMRLFASGKLTTILQKFRPPEGEAISAPILNRSIETAQKRIEQRNYTIRKHTLEYDDVMNKHRSEVYSFRNEVLQGDDIFPICTEILETFATHLSEPFFQNRAEEGGWLPEEYRKCLMSHFPITLEEGIFSAETLTSEEIETIGAKKVVALFKDKLKREAEMIGMMQMFSGKEPTPLPIIQNILRSLLIQAIDKHWQEHLLAIDHLRTEVSMRSVAQKDPLVEFKHEAFGLFEKFSRKVRSDISHLLFAFGINLPDNAELKKALSQMKLIGPPPALQKSLLLFP